MQMAPKLKFTMQLFGQDDEQIGEITNLTHESLPCRAGTTTLAKILGCEPNPQTAVDQLHVQQLLE
jgi:hypothetical protein